MDIVDHFINRYGILVVAVVSMVAVAWIARALGRLAAHMNLTGSIKLGRAWKVVISTVAPLALTVVLVRELQADIADPYEGYPTWMLWVFGWGAAIAVVVLAFLATRVRWRPETSLEAPPDELVTQEVGP